MAILNAERHDRPGKPTTASSPTSFSRRPEENSAPWSQSTGRADPCGKHPAAPVRSWWDAPCPPGGQHHACVSPAGSLCLTRREEGAVNPPPFCQHHLQLHLASSLVQPVPPLLSLAQRVGLLLKTLQASTIVCPMGQRPRSWQGTQAPSQSDPPRPHLRELPSIILHVCGTIVQGCAEAVPISKAFPAAFTSRRLLKPNVNSTSPCKAFHGFCQSMADFPPPGRLASKAMLGFTTVFSKFGLCHLYHQCPEVRFRRHSKRHEGNARKLKETHKVSTDMNRHTGLPPHP